LTRYTNSRQIKQARRVATLTGGLVFLTGLAALVLGWPVLLARCRSGVAATSAALALLALASAFISWGERMVLRRDVRRRAAKALGSPLTGSSAGRRAFSRLVGAANPDAYLMRLPAVKWMLGYWGDAGLGQSASRMFLSVTACTAAGGFLLRWVTGSAILGLLASLAVTLGLATLVVMRALSLRRRFGEQLPDLLDRLADCLEAGFSLPQAFEFVRPNMPEPSSTETQIVVRQINLGYSVDQALEELGRRRPGPELELLIEGLVLQRQLGGNMTDLMRNLAGFVRTRQNLEAEVRTLTAQGRLSAVVIALLVPASLVLLSFFPGYVTVLLRTTIGNLILVAAALLELLGTAIVARVVRLEF